MDISTVKSLQSNKKMYLQKQFEIELQITENSKEKSKLQSSLNEIKSKIESIDKKIEMLRSDVVLSEHAILRYIERCMGIDLNTVKQEIIDEKTKDTIKKLGDGHYPLKSGGKIIVKDNVIVTVII